MCDSESGKGAISGDVSASDDTARNKSTVPYNEFIDDVMGSSAITQRHSKSCNELAIECASTRTLR